MGDRQQSVMIDIPIAWVAQLNTLATIRGVTPSDLMIEALRRFLQTEGKAIDCSTARFTGGSPATAIAPADPDWDDVEDEPDEILWSFLDDPNEGE